MSTESPSSAHRVSAVLLAAGMSRRMGARNKLLLPIDGVPMIARAAGVLQSCRLEEVVVVVGHQADLVRAALAGMDLHIAFNPEFAEGRATSVQVGLQALRAASDAVLVCLADQPRLTAEDIASIRSAFFARPRGKIAIPYFDGRRGNPVVFERSVVEEIVRGDIDVGCRRFIDRHPEWVYRIDFPTDHVVADVDDAADYHAFVEGPGR